MQPNDVRTSEDFVRFMEHVWEGGALYNDWHDARRAAKKLGMIRTGSTTLDGATAQLYSFPNERARVVIADDGAGCRMNARFRWSRKARA